MALKSAHGTYLCAQEDGQVVANRDKAKEWEYFIIEPLDPTGTVVRIRTWQGVYLHPIPDGRVSVTLPPVNEDVWGLYKNKADNTCTLRNYFGKYLTAEQGWGGSVVATYDQPVAWSVWKTQKIKAVNIRSYFGKYLCAEKHKDHVVADRDEAKDWEQWTLERAATTSGPGKAYYIKSYHGRYLCAEKKGHVIADRDNPQDWETWWIEVDKKHGHVNLRSYHGKYLCAEKHKGHVVADRDDAKDWERWNILEKDLSKGSASGYTF